MIDLNALNVYKINKHQHLILIYKVHTGTAPSIFFNKFLTINHNYPTSAKTSGNSTIFNWMKLTNFAISRRIPTLWNTVLNATLKEIESLPLFKAKLKKMLLSRDNELSKFNLFLLSYIVLYSYVIISDSLYYS